MNLTKFSVCSALAGVGYFAAAKCNVNDPFSAAMIGSQFFGRAVAYARTGDTRQLQGITYYLGTVATLVLGEALKYSGAFSPEMSFLVAGISLAVADSYIGDKIINDNILPRPRAAVAA